jgi:hypothetical protein
MSTVSVSHISKKKYPKHEQIVADMTVDIKFPAWVQLNPVGALHNPNTGLKFALMVQWAPKQSNKNHPPMHLVFAILLPQR